MTNRLPHPGYFGIGIYHCKSGANIGTLWRHAYIYGANFIFVIGRRYKKQSTDTVGAYLRIPLFEFETYEEFRKTLPKGVQVACVEMDDRAHSLPDYHHPDRVAYLLGAEDHGLPPAMLAGNQIISIPSVSGNCLNVAGAGTLVMYDRYLKRAAL